MDFRTAFLYLSLLALGCGSESAPPPNAVPLERSKAVAEAVAPIPSSSVAQVDRPLSNTPAEEKAAPLFTHEQLEAMNAVERRQKPMPKTAEPPPRKSLGLEFTQEFMIRFDQRNLLDDPAIAEALDWLAAHQLADGGWSFHHGQAPGHRGPVQGEGSDTSRTGATSAALLAFLHARQFQDSPLLTQRPPHRKAVLRGLEFLMSKVEIQDKATDLRGEDGSLNHHAMAQFALLEAYVRTGNEKYLTAANAAIQYTIGRQEHEGGWADRRGEPATASTTAWQLGALKFPEYYMPPNRYNAPQFGLPGGYATAVRFFRGVKSTNAVGYGNTSRQAVPLGTASAALAHVFCGHTKEIDKLAKELVAKGPAADDPEFNYFATNVIFNWDREEYLAWNIALRHKLGEHRVTDGTASEELGSWSPEDATPAARLGGRLLVTSLNVMTLSAEYHHLPLFWPLEIEFSAFPEQQ